MKKIFLGLIPVLVIVIIALGTIQSWLPSFLVPIFSSFVILWVVAFFDRGN